MRLNSGDVVGGKYRIVRLIGDGGMGAVYEARHQVLGSPVALKFLHSELTKRPGLASRFLQEARVSASIQSPHVTRVTDVDTTVDGSPYLVMELLTGESLQQLLDRRSKLSRDQALDFALQILSGLESAHELGVVHRDLKPDNVYITPSPGGPVLKLLDFGIAKLRESNEYQKGLTRPGALMGTPEYMAPEQLYAAEKVDHRADIYSLGAMLYEMLTGERPAYGDDAPAIIAQVAAGKVMRITERDPSLPAGLGDIVHKAISADKAQRFSSALEMRLALAGFAGQLSHAGRLAATPAPASAIAAAEIPPGTAPTVDAPELAAAKVQVSETWPPSSQSAGIAEKGGTQEAPKGLMRDLAAAAQAAGSPNAVQHAAPGPGYANPGGSAAYLPSGAGYGYGPPVRRKSQRALGAAIALVLGVLVTAAIVLAVSLSKRDSEEVPSSYAASQEPPPTTTITPQAGPVNEPLPTPPADQPVAAPEPVPAPKPPVRPRTDGGVKDAGASNDASQSSPFPLPLPSGFPPLPSGFPPLPSGFPQIPGFPPFPGQQPAPAPAQ